MDRPIDNALDEATAEVRVRLQQVLVLRDENPGDPALHDAEDTLNAELVELEWRRAQAAAPYVASVADMAFYG